MEMSAKKKILISILEKNNLSASENSDHKNVLDVDGLKLLVLSNFGGQVSFSGSKRMITDIRNQPIDDILYNGLSVDFFAIPWYGLEASGKRVELCSKWCFLPSEVVYDLIKKYKEDSESSWVSAPKSDWRGNINSTEFYWKSDCNNNKSEISWNNFDDLISKINNADDISDYVDEVNRDIDEINNDQSITDTEKEMLIKSRKGQGKYRKKLIEYWKGCAVSNCKNIELLKASHIKPWCRSNNKERLDVYNGLLLNPNFDALFDKGFISFDNAGNILISSRLDENARDIFHIHSDIKIAVNEAHFKYLEFHRDIIFKN